MDQFLDHPLPEYVVLGRMMQDMQANEAREDVLMVHPHAKFSLLCLAA